MADLTKALNAALGYRPEEEEEEDERSPLRRALDAPNPERDRARRQRGLSKEVSEGATLTDAVDYVKEAALPVTRLQNITGTDLRRALGETAITASSFLPESSKLDLAGPVRDFGQQQVIQANVDEGTIRPGNELRAGPPAEGVIGSIAQTVRDIPSSYERSVQAAGETFAELVADPVLGTDLAEGYRQRRQDLTQPMAPGESFMAEAAAGVVKMVGDLPKYAHPGLVVGDVASGAYTSARDRGDSIGESVTNAIGTGSLQFLTLRYFDVLNKVVGPQSRSVVQAGLAEGADEFVNTLGGQMLDVATSKAVDWEGWDKYVTNSLKAGVIGFGGGGSLRGFMNKMTPEEIDATAQRFIGAKVKDLSTPGGITFSDFHGSTVDTLGGKELGNVLGSIEFFRENFQAGKDLEIELKTGASPAKGEFLEEDGKIVLYVDNLKNADPRKTVATLFHEGTGHAMGEGLMGKDNWASFKERIKTNQPEWVQSMIDLEAVDIETADGTVHKGREISEDQAIEEYFPYWLESNWYAGGTTGKVFKAKALQKLSELTGQSKDKTEVMMQEALRDFKNKNAAGGKLQVTAQTDERRERKARRSLTEVDGIYSNDETVASLKAKYPSFWSNQEEADIDETQRAGTEKTMQKVMDWVEEQGIKPGKVLDVSAGLGINARVQKGRGWDVETTEPNPEKGRRDYGFEPDYEFSSDVEGSETYDLITNTVVLNVLPSGPREGLISDIGRLLKVGGTGVITTRSRGDVGSNKSGVPLGDGQFYFPAKGEYQRGFNNAELADYAQSILDGEFGAGKFDVEGGAVRPGGKQISPSNIVIKKTAPIGEGVGSVGTEPGLGADGRQLSPGDGRGPGPDGAGGDRPRSATGLESSSRSLDLSQHPIYAPITAAENNVPFTTKAGRYLFGTDYAISSLGGDEARKVLNARAIQRGVAGAIDQVLNYSGIALDDGGVPTPDKSVPAVNEIINHPEFLNTVGYLQWKQDQIALQKKTELFDRLSTEEHELVSDLATAESVLLNRQSKSEIRSVLTDIKKKQSQIEAINRRIKEPKREDVDALKAQRADLREEQKQLQNFLSAKRTNKLAMRIAKNEARLEELVSRADDMTSDTIEDNIELLKLEVQDIKSRIKGDMKDKTKEFLALNRDLIRYNEELTRLAVRSATGLETNIEPAWTDLTAKVSGALKQRKQLSIELRGEGRDVAGNVIKVAEELADARRELKYLKVRSKEDPNVLVQLDAAEKKLADLKQQLEDGQPSATKIREIAKIRNQIAKLDNAINREKRLTETEGDSLKFRQDQVLLKEKYRDEMSTEIQDLVNPFTKKEKRDAYRLSVKLRKRISDVRKKRKRAERLLAAGKGGLVDQNLRDMLEDYEDRGDPELIAQIQAVNESTKNFLLDSGYITQDRADEFDIENYFTASRYSPLFKEEMADVLKARKGGSDKLFTDPSVWRGIQARLVQLGVDTIVKRRSMELLQSMGVVSDPQVAPFEPGTETDSYKDEDGNVKNVQILDKPTYDAVMQTSDAFTIPGFSHARDLLRATVTNTPDFATRQFISDSITTGILRKEMIPVIDSVIGLWKASGLTQANRDLMREYKTAGGEMGYNYDLQADTDPARRAKLKSNPYFKWTAGLYQDILSTGEMANRLRLYEKLKRDPDLDTSDAVFAGRTLGADFGRRAEGALPKFLNAGLPFFNAGLQASHSIVEHLKRDPKTPIFRATMAMGIYATIRALNYAMFSEDEWEDMNKAIEAKDKVNFFHFYTEGEDGRPVRWRIPRDRNLGAVGALPEIWLDNLTGRDKEDMVKVLIAVAEAQVNTSLLPQALRPALEAQSGYDYYRGRYFIQPGKKGLPEDEFNQYTSELMKQIGEKTGLSPQRVEHAFKGYTGTIGTLALALSDAAFAEAGVIPERVNPASVGPVASGVFRMAEHVDGRADKAVSEYYELVGKIQDVNASYRARLETADDEVLTRFEKKYEQELYQAPYTKAITAPKNNIMKWFSDRIKELRADENLSGREKIEEMRKIERERNNYAREQLKELKRRPD